MTVDEARAFIRRAAWTSAKSTEDVGTAPVSGHTAIEPQRQRLGGRVLRFVNLIKTEGRVEEWTPPAEWVRRWGGRPMTNRYWHPGDGYAWFTWPRKSVPMLNREHISVQEQDRTRRPVAEQQRLGDTKEPSMNDDREHVADLADRIAARLKRGENWESEFEIEFGALIGAERDDFMKLVTRRTAHGEEKLETVSAYLAGALRPAGEERRPVRHTVAGGCRERSHPHRGGRRGDPGAVR